MVKKRYNLDQVTGHYSKILVDTSFLRPLGYNECRNYVKFKLRDFDESNRVVEKEVVSDRIEIAKTICYYLESGDGHYYFTKGVLEEIATSERNFNYKKIVRFAGGNCSKNKQDFLMLLQELKKAKSKLIRLVQEKEKVVSEEDIKEYQSILYNHRDLFDEFKLSEVDADLLAKAIYLVSERNKTAICSNDFGLLNAWKSFCLKNQMTQNSFGFFLRMAHQDLEMGFFGRAPVVAR